MNITQTNKFIRGTIRIVKFGDSSLLLRIICILSEKIIFVKKFSQIFQYALIQHLNFCQRLNNSSSHYWNSVTSWERNIKHQEQNKYSYLKKLKFAIWIARTVPC